MADRAIGCWSGAQISRAVDRTQVTDTLRAVDSGRSNALHTPFISHRTRSTRPRAFKAGVGDYKSQRERGWRRQRDVPAFSLRPDL